MVRLGMSKSIKGLDFIQGLFDEVGSDLNRVNTEPESSLNPAVSSTSAGTSLAADGSLVISKRRPRLGGKPIRSISGNPPTKPLGPIIGKCSQCDNSARTRFNGIQYCNKHYRENLQKRKDQLVNG